MGTYYEGRTGEIKGENYPPNIPNTIHYTTKDPIGVVCAIIPWNAPLFLTVAKIAPAIVAGNTVVLKTFQRLQKAYDRPSVKFQ